MKNADPLVAPAMPRVINLYTDLCREQCLDGWLSSEFLLYMHGKCNPHMIKQSAPIIRCMTNGDSPPPIPASLMLNLSRVRGRSVDLSNLIVFRLVIMRQFYFFLLRYGLIAHCIARTRGAVVEIERALLSCESAPSPRAIKWMLPETYRTSHVHRFHRQLFQYTKQFVTDSLTSSVNVEARLLQSLLARRHSRTPLAYIPRIALWTRPMYNALVERLTADAWCVGQNRINKITTLVELLSSVSKDSTTAHRFLCLIYHVLNAYINWFCYNTQQFVAAATRCSSAPSAASLIDTRCSACFKNTTTRSTRCKQKNVESLYCIDDRAFVASCCEAPLVCVDVSGFIVYSSSTHERYGPCARCAAFAVQPVTAGPHVCERCSNKVY
ncbi:ORF59 [Ranid herpesvirus 1]|uniref:ORF59 n=1 Tax=Ranid herpesvirus 1 TaxID=85655 RepID=Q14VP9_9VIRU|nr:ORF59 [Ranid herpesvirus 1]ABG25743.1 ORF59 [Ranid herpesvirus 1]